MMYASRLIDIGDMYSAYEKFSKLYDKDEIMGLYVREIACELAYTATLTGKFDQAAASKMD